MKHILFALVCISSSQLHADPAPAYVQTQVQNINQSIQLLKSQRAQLTKQLQMLSTTQGNDFQKQQLQAQIKEIDRQIAFHEQQLKMLGNH